MKWLQIAFVTLLAGCGVRRMLPQGPALSPKQLAAWSSGPSGVVYGAQLTNTPVLPLLPFGVAYDLDLVLVSDHPEWNMHEYARLQTSQGPVWLAKDARESTMVQTIIADLPDIEQWWPEIPLQRRSRPLQVVDHSQGDWLDLDLAYTNFDGQPVAVHYEGPVPHSRQSKRNGSTMGHSRDRLLAVLDLPLRDFAKRASVRIGHEPWPIKRLAGLVPLKMALVQTQGGLVTGSFTLSPTPTGLSSEHPMLDGGSVSRAWQRNEHDGEVIWSQSSPIRTLSARYRVQGEAEELVALRAEQWGRDDPTCVVSFSPALPDLRRRFEGRAVSDYTIAINGQQGLAIGKIEAWWDADGPRLAVVPQAPWWTRDRPLQSVITLDGDAVHVRVRRVELP